MRRKGALVLCAAGLAAAMLLAPRGGAQGKSGGVPKDYRNWAHVKSLVLQKGHPLFDAFGGIHHVYVNKKGEKVARAGGGIYPEGTIFVFDLYEAAEGGGALAEGKHKVTALMTKDKKFAETGGWKWEAFAAGDPTKNIVKDVANECWACHQPQDKSDYVFSKWRQ